MPTRVDHLQVPRAAFEVDGRHDYLPSPEQDGGLKVADVGAINRRLNRTPMGALAPGHDMDFPIEVLTRIIRPSGEA